MVEGLMCATRSIVSAEGVPVAELLEEFR